MRQAGLSKLRSKQRKYIDEQKAEVLGRFALVGHVSVVAREQSINRVTFYVWAYKAGIFPFEYADARRQEFLRQRREGVSRREAAARLGVEASQALDRVKGIRVFSRGRV